MKQDENKNLTPAEYISMRVKSGNYFKDAKDWLYGAYISSYKLKIDLLVIIVITAIVMVFFVLFSLFGVKSVKPKNGVVNLESDFEDEYIIQKIPQYYINNEKNIIRFILENYVEFFESYDTTRYNIYEITNKIKIIRQNSNKQVGDKFERIVRENYVNEVLSGFNRKAKVDRFEFVENNNSFQDKILNSILPAKPPKKVRVYLTSFVFNEDGRFLVKEEKRVVEITYTYEGIERDKDGNLGNLNLKVTAYNYIL
jgi:type IV secretory pathway component VirB8